MSFANFGIGVGALADGLVKGMQIGRGIKQARKERALEEASTQAFDAAKQAQQADIQTGAEAKPLMDYYMKVAAPRVRDSYLQNGDIQAAKTWGDWIKNDQVQKGMASWAAGVRAAQQGDHEGFLKHFTDAYNNNGYFDDGVQAVGSKVLKDDKGNVNGFEVTLRGKDGKDNVQRFDNIEDVYRTGLTFMSPEKVFEYGMGQIKAASEARAKLAEEDRKFNRDVQLEGVRQGGRVQLLDAQQQNALERQNNQSNLNLAEAEAKKSMGIGDKNDPVAKANAMAQALLSQGWSAEQVKAAYPRLLGVERASQSPRDRLMGAVELLTKTDPNFMDMTEEQKVASAQRLLDAQDKILMQNLPSAGSQQPAPQQGRGLPMWGPNGQYFIQR